MSRKGEHPWNYRHGHRTRPVPTAEYAAWMSMRARCEKPWSHNYLRYGGRGIAVCGRWSSFESFLADMGPKPPKMQLDRVDNNGNYEPGNCRWATPAENSQNRRSTKLNPEAAKVIRHFRAKGVPLNLLAGLYGVSFQAVSKVARGDQWAPARATEITNAAHPR